MYFPTLSVQEKFFDVWKYFELEALAPLTFNEAMQDQNPPLARLEVTLKSQNIFAGGSVGIMSISGVIYLPQATADRLSIEQALFRVSDEWRRAVSDPPVKQIMVDQQKVQQIRDRFKGGNIETLPVAWEMWYEVRNVRNQN